jgi:hypothetical protein
MLMELIELIEGFWEAGWLIADMQLEVYGLTS